MEKEVSRLYLQNTKNKKIKKFLNIIAIYNGGILYEYKITFEGFAGKGNWNFMPRAAFDSVKGFRKKNKSILLRENISVGYHSDGNVMYKSGTNFKPKKHLPIKDVDKPQIFLRVTGFSLSELVPKELKVKLNEVVLPLRNFSSHTKIACIIYMAKGARNINFDPRDKEHFKNSESINLYDEDNNISFSIHFFETNHVGSYVVMIQGKMTAIGRLLQHYRYYFFEAKDFLKRVKF